MSRHKKSAPRWRSAAAAEVMAGAFAQLGAAGRVLLAGEADATLRAAVSAGGATPVPWLRRAVAGAVATPWPEAGPYAAALVRLPRAKDELDMLLHAAAARVAPGGAVTVYGANDEGIRSAEARMQPLLGSIESLEQRAHCRVLVGRRPAGLTALRPNLDDWIARRRIAIAGTERDWVSYPGVFAGGSLDDGTRLLVAALTAESAPASVLDYGCGPGMIAAHVQAQFPQALLTLVDWDAIAMAAARQNVPGAESLVASRLKDLDQRRFDAIVSNPPIHDGKSEDYTVLGQLIAQAPSHLMPKGCLLLVVQRRVPVAEWLSAAFEVVAKASEDTRYTVWRAAQPRRRTSEKTGRSGRRSTVTPRDGRSNAARGRDH